jgi:hypothetical protein
VFYSIFSVFYHFYFRGLLPPAIGLLLSTLFIFLRHEWEYFHDFILNIFVIQEISDVYTLILCPPACCKCLLDLRVFWLLLCTPDNFILFYCLSSMAKTLIITLSKSWVTGYPYQLSDFRGKTFIFSNCIRLALCFSYTAIFFVWLYLILLYQRILAKVS